MYLIENWRHVFKLDPAKLIMDGDLEKICESGTDAVMVGGSSDVTYENTLDLLSRIRRYAIPCVLEVSQIDAVVPGFDAYFIPLVLNAGSTRWMLDAHQEGIKAFGHLIPWEDVITEGYVVLNGNSTVAKVTESRTDLSLDDVKAYAQLADQLLKLPVFYLEYSGTYGDPDWVRSVKSILQSGRFFYGGGITSPERAREMAQWADTIVAGNIIYENMEEALATVQAVKETKISF